MELLAGVSGRRFVQAPAEGHEQLGNAQAVMKALAFPQAPVRHADQALVTGRWGSEAAKTGQQIIIDLLPRATG
jgi:hypothetical protein